MAVRPDIPTADAGPIDRFMASLPGWLLLLGGITLMAMALLTPAWLALRDLQWQQDVMEAQVHRLLQQQQRYAAFLAALESEDPVLLEHLAYTQLRMVPTGKDVLEGAGGIALADASVAEWLYQPMPRLGQEMPLLPELNSRMTRLTSGPMRMLLCIAALTCAAAGVFWRGKTHDPRANRPWMD